MNPVPWRWRLLSCLLLAPLGVASPDELANQAFRIRYDSSGIRSLKRTNDLHDTEYIRAGGILGNVQVRFRTTPNGHWREAHEIIGVEPEIPGGGTIRYTLGTPLPALAAKSTPSAPVGAGGLRALNDGQVPSLGGRRGRGGRTGGFANRVPFFTWSGSRGEVQWVQYAFPVEEEVSRAEVFWVEGAGVSPPRSWRLLYRRGLEWREVRTRSPYGLTPNGFSVVEFDPVRTSAMRIEVAMPPEATVGLAEWRVGPEHVLVPLPGLRADLTFRLDGDVLDWTVRLANDTPRPIEIGDLAVPLDFAERTPHREEIYTKKLLRHALVAGHGSWIYWQRSGGDGPYLVMTTQGRTGFEYYDSSGGVYTPYIHAGRAAAAAVAEGGNWRLPVTGLKLSPKGSPGSDVAYSFRFQWAKDFAAVRDVLYRENEFDTVVVPGMTIPVDLPAMISLRTRNRIDSVEAEYPDDTRIELAGDRPGGIRIYKARFSRLGENMLKIRYGDGRWASLEFFVTEPLETLIRKRAAFLVSHHQHEDPDKWYAGAYGDWDQKNEILRGPEDRDGLSTWLTDANDDAGNARPAYIASKNVFFPDRKEIESLELYLSRYLWGGMQMTDEERYPYALYGIPNWKVNRESTDEGRNGRAHVWRIYDYPHIIMLYYRMYQIARFYPDMVRHLDAGRYLERAYRTAVAYWTVPKEVEGWSANDVGTMNEAFIPELVQSLEEEGKKEWADTLRSYWESKVERFVNDTPNLYGSEFSFDSTGFESTGAFAGYAMRHVLGPGGKVPDDPPANDFQRRVTYDAALKFMNFQLLLNMSDRGWLETSYYQLGSDYRGSMSYLLSYMSQMGGWSILDYGLHFAADPTDYLRLGYASSLSSWALVNSGTEQSGYGYWNPSGDNDGATGGGFVPEAMGRGWIGKRMARGAWYYSAEEDVGYCGALRTHATVVARDPIFGEMAYGGLLVRDGDTVKVTPRDGLRVRFHVVRDDQRLHMVLDHDGYAGEEPVEVSDDLSRIRFRLENRTGGPHETGLEIAGLPPGEYTVAVGDRIAATIRGGPQKQKVALPVGAVRGVHVTILRTRAR